VRRPRSIPTEDAVVIPGSPATVTLRRLLTELGESGRTGALHVGGRPGGALYLIAGRIAYAETPACPGIGDRLVASGRIRPEAWRAALAEGRGAHRVGPVLLHHGLIGRNELALRVVAAMGDAMWELLRTVDGPVRLVAGERDWFGDVALGRRTAPRLRWTVPGPDAQRVRLVSARSPQDGPR
jgi:hypothetical protein